VLHTNIEPRLPKRGLNGIMRSTIAACAILVLLLGTADAEQCPPGALGVSRTLVVGPNVVALVTPAAARSRLVVLDRPTLACSDQQALETALTLARLHDGPAFRDHARSYGCMWIEPDDGPLAVVGGSAWGNVQVMVRGVGLFWIWR
jgi:hypothetical protein